MPERTTSTRAARTGNGAGRARFVLGFLALLAACTGVPVVLDERASNELTAIERALSDRDVPRARRLFDALAARAPDAAESQRAARLEVQIRERELAPYGPSFDALDAALADHETEVAARVLERLRTSGAPESVIERAQGYERVVAGRQLVAGLDLRLEIAPTDKANVFALTLTAAHAGPEPLVLRAPGGSLSFFAVGVDPTGIERRSAVNRFVDVLAEVELEPKSTQSIALGEFSLAIQGLIASRGRWELSLSAGTFELAGRDLPAMNVAVAPCELVRLDPRLPSPPVEPAELVRYVEAGAPSMPALLERTVRIENSRRREALDALIAPALRLDDERLQRIVPALRWLGGERDLGGDPRVWRAWLEQRLAAGRDAKSGRGDALELETRELAHK